MIHAALQQSFKNSPFRAHLPLPKVEMALIHDQEDASIPPKDSKIMDAGGDGVPAVNYDTEKPTRKSRFSYQDKHVGGRIAPVLPHLRNYDFGTSDAESVAGSDILGKQIELEAGNALQYRTCSWPKVCFLVVVLPR